MTRSTIAPTISQAMRNQPGDRGLSHLLGQVGDDVFEVAREARAARPRDGLHADPAVRALHAPDRAGHVATLGAEVEVAPAAQHSVVSCATDLPAARAHRPPATQTHADDDPLPGE